MAVATQSARKRRQPVPERRLPTYGAATRMARILYDVLTLPRGRSFASIQEGLDISRRTLYRYIAAWRSELVDEDDRPLLEVIRQGPTAFIRRADHAMAPATTVFKVLSLYLGLTVLKSLEGTAIKEGADDVWEKLRAALDGPDRLRLAHFEKKFFAIQHAAKDYREFDEQLDTLVQALVYQNRVRIEYEAVGTESKVHDFDPYTLVMHRGGLYLIGRSSRARKILTLAVERVRAVEKLGERFDYPLTYSPEKHTAGSFGIIVDEKPIDVEILIMDPATVSYVRSRRVHPTQRFKQRSNGQLVLSMTVQGTAELRNWLLSFGPHVKVLKPRSLQLELRDLHAQAAGLYGAS